MGKKNKKKGGKSSATSKHSNSGKDSEPCSHDLKSTSVTEITTLDQIQSVQSSDEKDGKTSAAVPGDTSTIMAGDLTTKDTEDLCVKDQKKEKEGELESGQKQNCVKHSKEIYDLQMKLSRQKEEIKVLNTKIGELKRSPDKQDQMTKRLEQERNEFKKMKKELEELNDIISEKDTKIHNLESKEEMLHKKIEDCHDENAKQIQVITEKDAIIDELKVKEENLVRNFQDTKAELEHQISKYKSKTDSLTVNLSKSISERDSYKTRFSQLAGSKLMYRNEGITDLSDNNRPDKLAERYNELYDNQWTDAFEEINEDSNDDKETIDKLLTMLKDCVQLCTNTADGQKVRIQEFFKKEFLLLNRTQDNESTCNGNPDSESTFNEISDNDMKNLTDIRKSYGRACLTELQKIFYEKYPNHNTKSHHISCYIEKCLEICWFAAIQEPPLSLDWNYEHGSDIQSGLVKNYTVSGNKVDFVVWPTLKLAENGSLLVKGVVQAINEKKSRLN